MLHNLDFHVFSEPPPTTEHIMHVEVSNLFPNYLSCSWKSFATFPDYKTIFKTNSKTSNTTNLSELNQFLHYHHTCFPLYYSMLYLPTPLNLSHSIIAGEFAEDQPPSSLSVPCQEHGGETQTRN